MLLEELNQRIREKEERLKPFDALVGKSNVPDSSLIAVNDVRISDVKKSPVDCTLCGKQFANRSTYNRHNREVHNREMPQYAELKDIVTRFCCLDCNLYFHNNMHLRYHLDEKHEEPWELEEMEFNSVKDFKTWLLTEQSSNNLQYVLTRGSGSSEKCYYECWRSASSNHSAVRINRKRALKKTRSCKMAYACTSQIIMNKDYTTGKCKVAYYKTHYGHEWQDDLLYLPISTQVGMAVKINSETILRSKEARKKRKHSFLHEHKIAQDAKEATTLSSLVRQSEILDNSVDKKPENKVSSPPQEENKEKIINQIEVVLQTISANVKNEEHSFEQLQQVLKSVHLSLEMIDGFKTQNSDLQVITVDMSQEISEVQNDHRNNQEQDKNPGEHISVENEEDSNELNHTEMHGEIVGSFAIQSSTKDDASFQEESRSDGEYFYSEEDIEFVNIEGSNLKDNNVQLNDVEYHEVDEESNQEIIVVNLDEEIKVQ